MIETTNCLWKRHVIKFKCFSLEYTFCKEDKSVICMELRKLLLKSDSIKSISPLFASPFPTTDWSTCYQKHHTSQPTGKWQVLYESRNTWKSLVIIAITCLCSSSTDLSYWQKWKERKKHQREINRHRVISRLASHSNKRHENRCRVRDERQTRQETWRQEKTRVKESQMKESTSTVIRKHQWRMDGYARDTNLFLLQRLYNKMYKKVSGERERETDRQAERPEWEE